MAPLLPKKDKQWPLVYSVAPTWMIILINPELQLIGFAEEMSKQDDEDKIEVAKKTK